MGYAKAYGYTRYTSTLIEAWRISIVSLSKTILEALDRSDTPPELSPDEDYTQDSIAAFGIFAAQQHHARGLTLGMFLSLVKYYWKCRAPLCYRGS